MHEKSEDFKKLDFESNETEMLKKLELLQLR